MPLKVSVVVTAYNLAQYLGDTLASVLEQSRPADEVLVIDDCSTDATQALLAAYGDRIRVLRNEQNSGVLRSTLRGIREARGDVLCFLDGDDLWSPTKLEEVVAALEQDPEVVLVSHDYVFIDSEARLFQSDDPSQAEPQRLAQAGDKQGLNLLMRRSVLEVRGQVWLGSAWCVRSAALSLPRFEQWLVEHVPDPAMVYQDHPLATFLALTSTGRFAYIPSKLFRYRVHASYSGGAVSLERAVLILEKGRATRLAMISLLKTFGPELKRELAVQQLKIRDYEFLQAVYRRDLVGSIENYLACARGFWSWRNCAKEALRMSVILTLGVDTFFTLKGRVRVRMRPNGGAVSS